MLVTLGNLWTCVCKMVVFRVSAPFCASFSSVKMLVWLPLQSLAVKKKTIFGGGGGIFFAGEKPLEKCR